MQEVQIPLKGIALTPYSDVSPDGQLSACHMLEPRDGGLRPFVLAGDSEDLSQTDVALVYIHSIPGTLAKHLIFAGTDGLYYGVEGSLDSLEYIGPSTGIKSVVSVGNTLIVLSSNGNEYYLFKEGTYKTIGTKPSEINISFGLKGYVTDYTTGEELKVEVNGFNAIIDKDIAVISEKVWSAVNQVKSRGDFSGPFFVRAAYRMHNEKYTMLTPPVLMIPDSIGPRAYLREPTHLSETDNGNTSYYWKGVLAAQGVVTSLMYKVLSLGNIEDWKDIIKSIDIFVTPQVYSYHIGEKVTGFESLKDSFGIYADYSDPVYKERAMPSFSQAYFYMPWKDEEELLSDIEGLSQFYLVHSFSVDEYIAKSQYTHEQIEISAGTIANLTLQDSLADSSDYQSHDLIMADGAFVYNQRVHLFGITRKVFKGFSSDVMWPYTENGTSQYHIAVWISHSDGTASTVVSSSSLNTLSLVSRFFYYPDSNATRMIVYDSSGNAVMDVPLKPHPFLNGAYFLWMNNRPTVDDTFPVLPAASDSLINIDNKLYVSEADNPFHFPLENIYTVGAGSIIGLSTVATALSEGQYGTFPLMVFCTDGNYSLSVTSDGKYGNVHPPMSRDVCTNPSSITQTDSEVLFVSAKGVMVTAGASARLLSGDLEGCPDTFIGEVSDDVVGSIPPVDFFQTCRITYDYANQRILFTGNDSIAYVYSIVSASWSTCSLGDVKAAVGAFPNSYLQIGNRVVKLNRTYSYSGPAIDGTILTRPVKFDSLQHKVIYQINLQGVFKGPQLIKIYGSREGISWCYLGMSQGSRIGRILGRSFKYYRFGIATSLAPYEHITGLRVVFDTRSERRLR